MLDIFLYTQLIANHTIQYIHIYSVYNVQCIVPKLSCLIVYIVYKVSIITIFDQC